MGVCNRLPFPFLLPSSHTRPHPFPTNPPTCNHATRWRLHHPVGVRFWHFLPPGIQGRGLLDAGLQLRWDVWHQIHKVLVGHLQLDGLADCWVVQGEKANQVLVVAGCCTRDAEMLQDRLELRQPEGLDARAA